MIMAQWLPANIAKLARLIALNGGTMEINGTIGIQEPSTANRYGLVSLTVQEAFELTYLRGAFDAICMAHQAGGQPVDLAALKLEFDREIRGIQIEIASPEVTKQLLAGTGPAPGAGKHLFSRRLYA